MKATALLLALAVPGVVAAPAPPSPPRRSPRRSPSPRIGRDPRLLLPRHHPVRHLQDHRGLRSRDRRDRLRRGAEGGEPGVDGGQRRRAGEPALHRATSSSTRARWWSWTRRTRSASRCSTGCGSSWATRRPSRSTSSRRSARSRGRDGRDARGLRQRSLAGAADLDQPLPARREHRGHVLHRPGGREPPAHARRGASLHPRPGSRVRGARRDPGGRAAVRPAGGALPPGAHEPRPRADPRRRRPRPPRVGPPARLREPGLRPDGGAAREGRAPGGAAPRRGPRAGLLPGLGRALLRRPRPAGPRAPVLAVAPGALRARDGPAGRRLRRARQRRGGVGRVGVPPDAVRRAVGAARRPRSS